MPHKQDFDQGLGKRMLEIRKTEKRHIQGRVDKKEGQYERVLERGGGKKETMEEPWIGKAGRSEPKGGWNKEIGPL